MAVATSAQSAETSSLLHNDWETNDWLSLGILVPAPLKYCEEKNNQPPCYRVKQPPIIVRAEVGRFRFNTVQFNLASGSMGLDWIGREHIRIGLPGVGAHWRLSNPKHEVGFLFQLISLHMGPESWGSTNTNVHFRINEAQYFLEAGVDFSVFWVTNPLGNEKPWGNGIEGFPFFMYVSAGI